MGETPWRHWREGGPLVGGEGEKFRVAVSYDLQDPTVHDDLASVAGEQGKMAPEGGKGGAVAMMQGVCSS